MSGLWTPRQGLQPPLWIQREKPCVEAHKIALLVVTSLWIVREIISCIVKQVYLGASLSQQRTLYLTQTRGPVCLRGCLAPPTADDSKVAAASLLDLPSAELVATAGKRIKSSLTWAEVRLFPKGAGLKPVASASPGSLVGNAQALALVQTLRLRFSIEYDPQLGVCSHLRSSGLSIPCLC